MRVFGFWGGNDLHWRLRTGGVGGIDRSLPLYYHRCMSRKPYMHPAIYLVTYLDEYIAVGFSRHHSPLIKMKDEAARLAECHIGFAVTVQVNAVPLSAGCGAADVQITRHTPQD